MHSCPHAPRAPQPCQSGPAARVVPPDFVGRNPPFVFFFFLPGGPPGAVAMALLLPGHGSWRGGGRCRGGGLQGLTAGWLQPKKDLEDCDGEKAEAGSEVWRGPRGGGPVEARLLGTRVVLRQRVQPTLKRNCRRTPERRRLSWGKNRGGVSCQQGRLRQRSSSGFSHSGASEAIPLEFWGPLIFIIIAALVRPGQHSAELGFSHRD